jgi:hypothetical protein
MGQHETPSSGLESKYCCQWCHTICWPTERTPAIILHLEGLSNRLEWQKARHMRIVRSFVESHLSTVYCVSTKDCNSRKWKMWANTGPLFETPGSDYSSQPCGHISPTWIYRSWHFTLEIISSLFWRLFLSSRKKEQSAQSQAPYWQCADTQCKRSDWKNCIRRTRRMLQPLHGADLVCYHLVDKSMPQRHALGSGARLSRKFISRVWTHRNEKYIKSVSSMQLMAYLFSHFAPSDPLRVRVGWNKIRRRPSDFSETRESMLTKL